MSIVIKGEIIAQIDNSKIIHSKKMYIEIHTDDIESATLDPEDISKHDIAVKDDAIINIQISIKELTTTTNFDPANYQKQGNQLGLDVIDASHITPRVSRGQRVLKSIKIPPTGRCDCFCIP